jgi:hypothetical protein
VRLFEVARPQVPATHPILAVVEIDRAVWEQFRLLMKTVPGARIAAHCPSARGKVTVYLGVADDKVRQVLESQWSPRSCAS